MERSRTISWQDPVESAAGAQELSGLDYLIGIKEGRIPPPPIGILMDFKPVELAKGRVMFAVTPQEFHYNPIGVVHGGLAATLLDSAMGCAVQTRLPAGMGYTTLEIKVNFDRPITRETGRVLCEAKVVNGGRTIATAEGRVWAEESGKLLAHGTTTCLLFSTNGA